MNRYGCRWPDGSETGRITDHQSWAANYARQHDGEVIDYDERDARFAAIREECERPVPYGC